MLIFLLLLLYMRNINYRNRVLSHSIYGNDWISSFKNSSGFSMSLSKPANKSKTKQKKIYQFKCYKNFVIIK